MSEIKTEVRTYLVEYHCDECENGLLRTTGAVQTSNPPRYEHVCTNCDTRGYMFDMYPHYRQEPIEPTR